MIAIHECVDVLAIRDSDASGVRHRQRELAHHVLRIFELAGEDSVGALCAARHIVRSGENAMDLRPDLKDDPGVRSVND